MKQTGALLEVEGIDVGYGRVRVLRGVSLSLDEGELVTVIGSNGAGKSTLLKALSGTLRPTAGSIRFAGEDITRSRVDRIVAKGLVQVPEDRRIFRLQTVAENLALGCYGLRLSGSQLQARYDEMFELFPVLARKEKDLASTLSGGEQQMLALAQGLMRNPVLLLVDEPSLGLSPLLVDSVFSALSQLRERGTTVLLVEQLVDAALGLSDRGYVLSNGVIVASGTSEELRSGGAVQAAYLGSVTSNEAARTDGPDAGRFGT